MSRQPAVYTYQRGEPISYSIEVESGDPTGYVLTAKLKPLAAGAIDVPPPSVAEVATFSSSFVPGGGGLPPHWLLTISAASSASLPAGRYIADECLSLVGTPVMITDPVIIVIKNSVSG